MTTKEEAARYLGKRVKVVMNEDLAEIAGMPVDERARKTVIVTGVLVGLGEGGDFEILEPDGFIHYCWPMLRIEPVERCTCDAGGSAGCPLHDPIELGGK